MNKLFGFKFRDLQATLQVSLYSNMNKTPNPTYNKFLYRW